MSSFLDRLGVPRRINAAGTLTRLGGSLMAPEVLEAMREAASSSVDMAELQSAASGTPVRAMACTRAKQCEAALPPKPRARKALAEGR